jgi:hypothetical protein
MERTHLGVAPLLVIALLAPLCLADAGTVDFIVDGETVAQLQCSEFPAAKPIKLAGRSGGSGAYQRSGLIDNVFIELFDSRQGVICDQDFECYDVSYWTTYGSPSPVVLTDFGNPAPCLMSSGDSYYDSGVTSQALHDWSHGFSFALDAYVNAEAAYHSVEVGISDQDVPPETGVGHIIGVNWKTSGQGVYMLQLDTDIETVQVPAPAVGEWHRIEIVGTPGTPVERTSWGRIKARVR